MITSAAAKFEQLLGTQYIFISISLFRYEFILQLRSFDYGIKLAINGKNYYSIVF